MTPAEELAAKKKAENGPPKAKRPRRKRANCTSKSLRMKVGLRPGDVANAIGVSRANVDKIEKGTVCPNVLTAIKLAKFYGVPVEEMFSEVAEEGGAT